MLRISIVVGTRPEIIKMSPIVRECERLNQDYFILHSGQHYSYNMDRVFFEQLDLPDAKFNLEVGSGSHAEQTGKILVGVEKILLKEKPNVVLVEGDTNTVLGAALASAKLGIKVGHVEAGLRSYDRRMPEELNRVLADHCSDFLFSPTERSKLILVGEGVAQEKISVTGNTVVDAVFQNLRISKKKRASILGELDLEAGGYFVATVHRQENVDDEKRFRGIVEGFGVIREKFGTDLIYPIHPRAKKRLKALGLRLKGVKLVEPLDYLGFLQLESNARLVLTDSGGVQEEACILKVPCVTLRDNTERPETLDVGANMLAGTRPERIVECVQFMLGKTGSWENPFGDGEAGKRIVEILRQEFD